MTGVVSGDFIDSEGNHVSVDDDYSRADELYDFVKETLKIEIQNMDDYKSKKKLRVLLRVGSLGGFHLLP